MASVVVVLIIVIAFVASLHVYAKWFWRHTPFLPDRTRDRIIDTERDPWNRMSMESHRYNRPRHSMNGNNNNTIGLDKGVIESLPIFSYKGTSQSCHVKPNNVIKENYALSQQQQQDDDDDGGGGNDEEEQRSYGVLECAVCLCEFEAYEKGRFLPSCHHSFHIDCIDMWFISHSTCPLCRTPVTYHNNEASSSSPSPSPSSLPLLFLLHNNNNISSSNEEEWSFSRQHGGDSCSSTRSFTPQIMSNHNLFSMMESNVDRYNPSMSNELYSNVMDKEGCSSSFSSSSQRTPQKSSSFRLSMKRLLSMERVGRSSRVVPSTTTCGSSSEDYDENHHDHLQEAQAQEKAEAAGVKEESQDQMWPSDPATSSTVVVISL